MSVINCLPRNDAAISRDRCKALSREESFPFSPRRVLSMSFFLFRSIPRPSSEPSFISALPSCASPVRSFVRTSLARPVPPFRLLRFFLSIGPGLVMHLNNLFISDSTLRATRPLVIMRGKHSRVPRDHVAGFLFWLPPLASFDVSFPSSVLTHALSTFSYPSIFLRIKQDVTNKLE